MRTSVLLLLGTGITTTVNMAGAAQGKIRKADDKPNIILIMCDDLGYGDLSCYGHPTISTPNIDRMAAEGMKLTQFYTGAAVSSPSRAAIMTGRYPIHTGMYGDQRDVLSPVSTSGLPQSEQTMGSLLRDAGYVTACIGKWHLGHLDGYLPTDHGFDYYYGIPYSNDMWVMKETKEVPIMENKMVLDSISDLSQLTDEYTRRAVRFIEENKDKPFFLYFPHTFPHTPLYASQKFKGMSRRGLYGDVMMDLDWSIGEVMACLKKNHLDKNTLVIFTSDNGPWLVRRFDGGSAGLFTEGKATTWEGGFRVPCIAWFPGVIQPSSVSQSFCSSLDLLPTFVKMSGAPKPKNQLDGQDLSILFSNPEATVREKYFFYWGSKLFAVRKGPWKLHIVVSSTPYPKNKRIDTYNVEELYNVETDPSEKYNQASRYPEIVADLKAEIAAWLEKNPPKSSIFDNYVSIP